MRGPRSFPAVHTVTQVCCSVLQWECVAVCCNIPKWEVLSRFLPLSGITSVGHDSYVRHLCHSFTWLKPDNSNSHGFELHRPSNKGTKLLLKVIKAIIIIIRNAIWILRSIHNVMLLTHNVTWLIHGIHYSFTISCDSIGLIHSVTWHIHKGLF